MINSSIKTQKEKWKHCDIQTHTKGKHDNTTILVSLAGSCILAQPLGIILLSIQHIDLDRQRDSGRQCTYTTIAIPPVQSHS